MENKLSGANSKPVINLFANLNPSLQEVLISSAQKLEFDSNQYVVWQEDDSQGLFWVESGWLKAQKHAVSGRVQTIRFIGPGETFGEVSGLTAAKHPASVIALEPAAVWLIPRQSLLALIEKHPDLAWVMIENLAQRVHYLSDLVEDLSMRPVESRLARLLLENAESDVFLRRRWATQAVLSERLGTVPDVLRRALRNLEDMGLIKVDRTRITLLDRKALQAWAMMSIPSLDEPDPII